MNIKAFITSLLEVKSYACNIKTKNSDIFMVLSQKDDLLAWFKSDTQEPYLAEFDGEITRLDKSDILKICYQPITKLRRMIQPVTYSLTSNPGNLIKSFFKLILLTAAGLLGWGYLKGQMPTAIMWFKQINFLINELISILGFILAVKAARVTRHELARVYWEKHDLSNALIFQVLAVGIVSGVFIPSLVNDIFINLH